MWCVFFYLFSQNDNSCHPIGLKWELVKYQLITGKPERNVIDFLSGNDIINIRNNIYRYYYG